MELEKFEGLGFEFGRSFTCGIDQGQVLLEQYSEGPEVVEAIKTEKQFIQLYEVLTGKDFDFNDLRPHYISGTGSSQ